MAHQGFRKLYHSIYSLHYHLVLVTKYRRRCLTKTMLKRLDEIFGATAEKWECEVLEFNGESDHVHLLVSLNPKVRLTVFINNMKTVSSRLLRKEYAEHLSGYYRDRVLWSRSYCLLSCGGAPLSVIKEYIAQQAEPGTGDG